MAAGAVGQARQSEWTAAAGLPDGAFFRSPWERRLAAALDRIGIKWAYEPDYFNYHDGGHIVRRYTPDFRLDDFRNTYVEVKGPKGSDAGDDWKMRRVLTVYPKLVLLLWDAALVEYIEDVPDASYIVGLLERTRMAA